MDRPAARAGQAAGEGGNKSAMTQRLFLPLSPVTRNVTPVRFAGVAHSANVNLSHGLKPAGSRKGCNNQRAFCHSSTRRAESHFEPWAAKPTENFACQFRAFSQHSFTHAFGAGKSQGTCGKRLMGEPLRGVIRRTSQSSSSYPRDSRLRIPATAKGLLLTDAKYPMFEGMKAWRTPNCLEGCGRNGRNGRSSACS